ncbi:MAG TPA: SUMF1/EgtB/PvdO family nonheme iron enzyme, partial [Planctomycetota bacterium]|nr:SUMF1/EgtB/PvdO family nonheme iron enzyme [Planctomycetota bacterium]
KVGASGPSTPPPPIVKTALGTEMVVIPAGDFMMGSTGDKKDESPRHRVHIDSFLLDRTEVTQALYAKVRWSDPSHFKEPARPVEQVTWPQAALFCNVRSKAEGLDPCYDEDTGACDFSKSGYRLPTEAEWEYACRAGGEGETYWGSGKPGDTAWFSENSGKTTHPVAQKAPNAWGLYDMCGNVAEWCNDVYAKDYYGQSPRENPHGPAAKSEGGDPYVLRGGSWNSGVGALRSSYRAGENPGFSDACLARDAIGFRCARRAPAAEPKPAPKSGYLQAPAPARTGLVSEDIYREHQTGAGFPERPERLEAIVKALKGQGLFEQAERIHPMANVEEWITRVHSPEYLARVKSACAECRDGAIHHLDTGDMPISAKSYDVALAAVGGVLAACDAVASGKVKNAFCAIRPPGHHAGRDRAMGFCLFNNVAIAARFLQKKHGLSRILIVDWDVHHGNGTQDAFYSDGSVMYFSTHLSPFNPRTGDAAETGEGPGKGLIVNVPLPEGAGDAEVLKAYGESLKPAALAFKPDFVLVSCGFDSHQNDTLGRLAITTEGFAKMTRIVKEIASASAKGRVVSMLEGGYNLDNLASASVAHVKALMD